MLYISNHKVEARIGVLMMQEENNWLLNSNGKTGTVLPSSGESADIHYWSLPAG